MFVDVCDAEGSFVASRSRGGLKVKGVGVERAAEVSDHEVK